MWKWFDFFLGVGEAILCIPENEGPLMHQDEMASEGIKQHSAIFSNTVLPCSQRPG
jgi:hypothetical protein